MDGFMQQCGRIPIPIYFNTMCQVHPLTQLRGAPSFAAKKIVYSGVMGQKAKQDFIFFAERGKKTKLSLSHKLLLTQTGAQLP